MQFVNKEMYFDRFSILVDDDNIYLDVIEDYPYVSMKMIFYVDLPKSTW